MNKNIENGNIPIFGMELNTSRNMIGLEVCL
jgi:hypothetical protein